MLLKGVINYIITLEMNMYRKYLDNLIAWLNDPYRKPLMVWGARQVGKTYLLKDMFAKTYFPKKTIYIDCSTNQKFVDYCLDHINAKEVIEYLSLEFGMVIDKDTLIIFDEAQECLPIITLMKSFCQDFSFIPVIVTGSMIRIKIERETKKRGKPNKKFLFPVGKINQLTIYPMNFEEFLINRNKQLYDSVLEAYKNKSKCSELVHSKAMEVFYEYLLIGGMPEAVDRFLETGSFQKAREVLKDLYDNYLSDMRLYHASAESIVRTKKIFENIYIQLNKESKNFKPSLIEKGAKNRDLRTPIDWLVFSFIINKSALLKEKVTIPLIESNETLFRIYLSDMGLFSYQSNINATTFIDKNSRNTLSGIFFENYVSTELVKSQYKLFYWKGKNNSEFEFIIEYDSTVIPIYVKKSRGTLESLDKFKNHNKLLFSIKVSENYLGYDDNKKILTVPFYSFPFVLESLKNGEIEELISSLKKNK